MTVNFNTNILSQLITQNPDKVVAINEQFPKIQEWQKKEESPSFNQLSNLAKFFNIPLGYLFLNEIPIKEYPIPHYRKTLVKNFKPSDQLQETLQTIQERQQWAKDILTDLRTEPLSFANSVKAGDDIETTAQKIRDLFALHITWAQGLRNWDDAFKLLLDKAENIGIFVVVNSVVNNKTKQKLDVNEFRGFVLYDNYAPFVFINNNDFISAKIFTLVHEIVHILVGKSASFELGSLMPANDSIEEYCNSVAAEFLVPQKLLLHEYLLYGKDYSRLARIFKVSRIVIARRLFDLNKITDAEFFSAYNSFGTAEVKNNTSNKGGDFYNTAPYRISKHFFNLVYSAVKQNKILYREAFRLTGLSPKSFDGYIQNNLT